MSQWYGVFCCWFFFFFILAPDQPVAVPGGSPILAALRPVRILQQQASPRGTGFSSLPGLCVADPPPVPMLLWVQRILSRTALRTCLCFSVWDLFGELHSWEVKQDICTLRQIICPFKTLVLKVLCSCFITLLNLWPLRSCGSSKINCLPKVMSNVLKYSQQNVFVTEAAVSDWPTHISHRVKVSLPEKTVSLWSWVNRPQELQRLTNPLYEANSLVIWPSVAPQSLLLWEGKPRPPVSQVSIYHQPLTSIVRWVNKYI